MTVKTGGPAFPRPYSLDPGIGDSENDSHEMAQEGMTLRDYFASQAARQAADAVCDYLVSEADDVDSWKKATEEAARHAKAAYIVADAMLAARATVGQE